HTE
ncbi:hypothetical protein D037_1803B, partial [Vibrio parahaemolyticus IDH02640]